MRVRSALVISTLLIGILSLLSINLTNAIIGHPVYWVPGVKAGDWATYTFSYTISSDSPNPPPVPPSPLMNVDQLRIEILSVDGTNVTFNTILYYPNGTEYNSQIETIDIRSGTAYFDNITLSDQTAGPIIGANLTVGDPIFTNSYSGTINETSEVDYAGSLRELNHFHQTLESGDVTQNIDFLWDRTSGIMVALNLTTINTVTGGSAQASERITIKETNIWQPTPMSLIGDVNQDGVVNVLDLVKVVMTFGSDPTMPNWNPACDLNGDNVIDILDLAIVAANFGQTR